MLRIGLRNDILVGIQVDSAAGLAHLHTLLGAWVDRSPVDHNLVEPALRVYLPLGNASKPKGPTLVPQVRLGSHILTRSRDPHEIYRALSVILGGIHAGTADTAVMRVGMRPFVSENRMVLVDADRPILVNDTMLLASGIQELPVWTTLITDGGTESAQATHHPALANLRWSAIGVDAPADPATYQLTGLVSLSQEQRSDADLVAGLARHSPRSVWFQIVNRLHDGGNVSVSTNRTMLRSALISALTA